MGTGVRDAVPVSLPSRPRAFDPQQNPFPEGVAPQAWESPVAMEAQMCPPDTGSGVAVGSVDPFPSCPKKLYPQQ